MLFLMLTADNNISISPQEKQDSCNRGEHFDDDENNNDDTNDRNRDDRNCDVDIEKPSKRGFKFALYREDAQCRDEDNNKVNQLLRWVYLA